ncbi:MAG: hypothetical protein E4H10_12685 [Bacteroidia bacterium]|nr:MAG: hypothetical protein E4H10_12685 [Bacteroidia bacterium]
MYKRIILSKGLSTKEKIKRLLAYYFRLRGARIVWNKYWAKINKISPAFKQTAEPEIEKAHIRYWKPFRRKVNPASLRVGKNISGHASPKCIPEEVFMSDIEPTLNRTSSVEYLSYKSFYNHWFPGDMFPKDYLHNIDGEWLDHDLNSISMDQVKSIAETLIYPVVLKPNRDSYGGSNISFPKSSNELIELLEGKKNFLVQEKLTQHSFYNQFNSHGINSVRVNIYRSVADNQLHIVNLAMRMGVGGSLDNLTSGGIGVMIRKDGMMDGYALDGQGRKFLTHPDTGITFDKQIPDFENLKSISLQVAGKILYARIICLDLCYDSEGRWRMIEVNINGTTLMFAQFHGVPFFDEYTDEVREYCLRNHWTLKQ